VSEQLIAALLLNFGAVAGGNLAGKHPLLHMSPLTQKIGWILSYGGVLGGLLGIYLFIQIHGWGYGLAFWFGSCVLSFLVLRALPLLEGIRTIVGILALIAGFAVYLRT
jgi:hypothetical protein